MNNRSTDHQSEQKSPFISKYKRAILEKIQLYENDLTQDEMKFVDTLKNELNGYDFIFISKILSLPKENNSKGLDLIRKTALLQGQNYIFSSLELLFLLDSLYQLNPRGLILTVVISCLLDRYELFIRSCYDNDMPLNECRKVYGEKIIGGIMNLKDRITNNVCDVAYSHYRFFRDTAVDWLKPSKQNALCSENTNKKFS